MNGVLQVWVKQSSTCIESQKKRFSSTNPRRKLTPIAKCLKSFKCLIQKRFDITSQVTWPRPPMTSYTSLFLLGLPTLACSLGRHSSHSWLEKFLISLGFTVITLGKYFLLNYWNFKRTCQKPRRWFTTQMAREVLEQNKTDRNWPTFFPVCLWTRNISPEFLPTFYSLLF